MDKAKAAVSNFLSRDGKSDTTVHERINPAIEHEKVLRTQQEEAQTVIDREVHQDHYHTSVQPIQHKEVLPEQHSHNMAAVEHREHHHGNSDQVKQRLEAEAAQFKSHREVGDVQRTSAEAPTIGGEHVHHHVHETIQPIIQKETIQPSVVHTTIPVHEVHHNEAKHHAISSLPTMGLNEFKQSGGSLSGREARSDEFAGEPRAIGSALGSGGDHYLGGTGAKGTTTLTDGDLQDGTGHHHHNITGNNNTRGGVGADGTSTLDDGNMQGGVGRHQQDTIGNDRVSETKKGGLMAKLNPNVDSNGDGKAGFMK